MTQLNITIPNSIYNGVQALASKENMSIDQFVALALGEKMSASMTEIIYYSGLDQGSDKF